MARRSDVMHYTSGLCKGRSSEFRHFEAAAVACMAVFGLVVGHLPKVPVPKATVGTTFSGRSPPQ